MRNVKKSLLLAIAMVIATTLVISSVGSVQVTEKSEEINELNISISNKVAHKMSVPTQSVNAPLMQAGETSSRAEVAFGNVGDDLHPAFDRAGTTQMAAYYTSDLDEIIWDFTTTDGPPYSGGVYYSIGGDYPSIKLWSGQEFYGTFVTDYLDLNGGPTYLFYTPDATDSGLYELTYWDWSGYGWSDMIDADIACDSSQESWEWGVSTYVTTSTYGDGYIDGPTVVYMDDVTSGSGWISWYYFNGCDHTDIDIDHSTIYSYAVYDWEDTDAGYFKILCRVQDFAEICDDNAYDTMFELDYGANTIRPAVAAGAGNIVILAETDVNGDQDILCYYGTTLETMTTSFVVDTTGLDEGFVDVRHVSDDTFICTYVAGGNLIAMKTEDAGATWTSMGQINDNDGCVVEEYKTQDLCGAAIKAMWEEDCGDDVDIYIGNVNPDVNSPPGAPTIAGPTEGDAGATLTYSFSADDPDGDDVKFIIEWGDGNSDTTGYVASGATETEDHVWASPATYTITAKAEDSFGNTGPSTTFSVTIPRSKVINTHPFLQFLQNHPNIFPLLSTLLGL
jgi:hypothetical protein